MLQDNFFKTDRVSSSETEGKTNIEATITIDKTHSIFNGHFPNQPIVPGVCMIQMIKELLENHLNTNLFFTSAGNIKFLAMINPEVNSVLSVDIQFTSPSNKSWDVDAKLFAGETTFFKVRGNFASSLN